MRAGALVASVALVAVLFSGALAVAHAQTTGTLAPTRISLHVPAIANGYVGINMTATLTGSAGNFTGGWETWYLDGKELGSSLVRCSSPCTLGESLSVYQCGSNCNQTRIFAPGTYNVTVTYNGTDVYSPSRAQTTFEVLASQTTVTVGGPPLVQRTYTLNPTQGQAVTVVVQQLDTLTLSLAIVASSAIIAVGIVLSSRNKRQRPQQA
jgi:hypothetical protein